MKAVNPKKERNHRLMVEYKGKRTAHLDNGDQPQSLAKVGNLAKKAWTVIG